MHWVEVTGGKVSCGCWRNGDHAEPEPAPMGWIAPSCEKCTETAPRLAALEKVAEAARAYAAAPTGDDITSDALLDAVAELDALEDG